MATSAAPTFDTTSETFMSIVTDAVNELIAQRVEVEKKEQKFVILEVCELLLAVSLGVVTKQSGGNPVALTINLAGFQVHTETICKSYLLEQLTKGQ